VIRSPKPKLVKILKNNEFTRVGVWLALTNRWPTTSDGGIGKHATIDELADGALYACGFHPLRRHHLSPPSMGPAGHLPLLRQQNAAAVCEMDTARLHLAKMWWQRVVQI
jgi:hypothetical protein